MSSYEKVRVLKVWWVKVVLLLSKWKRSPILYCDVVGFTRRIEVLDEISCVVGNSSYVARVFANLPSGGCCIAYDSYVGSDWVVKLKLVQLVRFLHSNRVRHDGCMM